MERRVLGRTGLDVSRLGLGGLFLSEVGGNNAATAHAPLVRAIERGVNLLDTAPTYANSEEVLGRALAGIEQPLLVSTKLGGRPTPFDAKNVAALHGSLERSLELLGRPAVDILFVHEPDRPQHFDWFDDFDTYDGPVNELLDQLKAEGLIRFTGIAGTTVYELARGVATGRYDVVLTAYNYSLLWTEAALAVLPEAERHGVGVIAGSPLQQGSLAKRYDEQIRSGAPWLNRPRRRQFQALYDLLDELDMELPELALRFVISNPAIDVVLTGARSIEEVDGSIDAVEHGPLAADVLARVQEIAAMVPFRPCEEPLSLPFERPYVGPGAGR
jgi:D-threo-aldose 1-dehydrogenase